jgi:hypothetical protein
MTDITVKLADDTTDYTFTQLQSGAIGGRARWLGEQLFATQNDSREFNPSLSYERKRNKADTVDQFVGTVDVPYVGTLIQNGNGVTHHMGIRLSGFIPDAVPEEKRADAVAVMLRALLDQLFQDSVNNGVSP